MQSSELIPSLALFTLIGVALIAVVGYVLFKRKRANRHPMDKSPDETIATVRVDPDAPLAPPVGSSRQQERDRDPGI